MSGEKQTGATRNRAGAIPRRGGQARHGALRAPLATPSSPAIAPAGNPAEPQPDHYILFQEFEP
jgi:hypothetical protein